LYKKEIRLGGSKLTLGFKCGSVQASNKNFNMTSVSPCWKAKIPSSCRTEASVVAAATGIIPKNFRFVIAQVDTNVDSTLRGANNTWNACAVGYLQINEDGGRLILSITGTFSEGRLSKKFSV
jgi:hypothetical protein